MCKFPIIADILEITITGCPGKDPTNKIKKFNTNQVLNRNTTDSSEVFFPKWHTMVLNGI